MDPTVQLIETVLLIYLGPSKVGNYFVLVKNSFMELNPARIRKVQVTSNLQKLSIELLNLSPYLQACHSIPASLETLYPNSYTNDPPPNDKRS